MKFGFPSALLVFPAFLHHRGTEETEVTEKTEETEETEELRAVPASVHVQK